MKRRGSITVFLTLMLTVLASFVTVLSQTAQRYVCKSEAVYAMDCAIVSCFGEYNRELFDRFGILLIDSSYKTDEGGIDRVRDHFSMYLSESLTANELVDVTVSDCSDRSVLPDEEIVRYMRDSGSPGFDPDNCFSHLSFTATLRSSATGDYTITREYSYDTEEE